MGEAARLPGRQTKKIRISYVLLQNNSTNQYERVDTMFFFRSDFERPILICHVRKTPRNRHSEFAFRQPIGCDASHIKSTYVFGYQWLLQISHDWNVHIIILQ